MKKLILSVAMLGLASAGFAQADSVTFQVDMNSYTGSFTTPELNGDFNSWCGNCDAMTDANNDGIWDIKLGFTQDSIEYKFSHDIWTGQEALTPGDPCTKTTGQFTNRFLMITGDTILPPVCWNYCVTCANVPPPAKLPMDFPITWDDTANTDYTVVDFGGNASMLAADPNNANNLVLQSVKGASAQLWAGTSFGNALNSAINFSAGYTTIKAVVYSPDANITVRMKAEDAGNPAISVETDATTSVANAWDTLTFDFSNQVSGTSAINFANTYDKLSIFYNFGVDGATAGSKTYYVDYIEFVQPTTPVKTPMDFPITWDDTANVDYTVLDFGGNASSQATDPTNANNLVLKSDKTASAQNWAGTTLGASLANAIPFASGSTTITAIVYSPDANIQVRMKAEDAANGTISVETEATTTKANAWDTLTFDFANNVGGTPAINFANTYDKLSIFYNFGVDGATAGLKTYYLDEVYFGGVPVNKVPMDFPITWDDTVNVDYTVLDFGGNASSPAADPMNAGNMVLKSDKTASAQLWAGTTFGASLGSAIPFTSTNTTISAMVYSPDANIQVRLKAEESADPTKSVETEATVLTANAWNNLVFDFNNQAAGTAALNLTYTYDKLSIFYNFGVDGATAGLKTYYVDMIDFGLITGVQDFGENKAFTLAPNPASQSLNLYFNDQSTGRVEVELLNALGQTVYKNTSNGSLKHSIDVSSLENGLYLVMVKSDRGASVSKVFVSH